MTEQFRKPKKQKGTGFQYYCSGLLFGLYIFLQLTGPNATAQEATTKVVIGEEEKLYSNILNEERTLLIGLPENYGFSQQQTFPVLYLLDGSENFHYTTAFTRLFESYDLSPGIIVVGISNTDRNRDLTPTTEQPQEQLSFQTSGGAEHFLDFVLQELIPHIEEKYRTHPYRILAGHSFGGLFALYSFGVQPDAFNSYIAISPSIWWNENSVISQIKTLLSSTTNLDNRLFITVGELEGPDPLRSTQELSALLSAEANSSLIWDFRILEDENHGTVAAKSMYQGLEFVFSNWSLRDPLATIRKFGYEAVENFYFEGGRIYGFDREVPLPVVSAAIVELAYTNRLDEAREIIYKERRSTLIPGRFFEFLGARFRDSGDVNTAEELFLQAIRVDPGTVNAKVALDEMGIDYSELFPVVTLSTETLNRYVGSYEIVGAGQIDIYLEAGALKRRFNGSEAILNALSDIEFYQDGTGTSYEFQLNDQSEVLGIVINQRGQIVNAARVQ